MTTFTYGLEYKRSTGQYENMTPRFEITDSQREGETFDQLVSRVVSKVESLLTAKINEIDADTKGR